MVLYFLQEKHGFNIFLTNDLTLMAKGTEIVIVLLCLKATSSTYYLLLSQNLPNLFVPCQKLRNSNTLWMYWE